MDTIKEHPILFSTLMVQAIVAGKKTQTRRLVKFPSWASDWKDFETDGKTAQIICAKTGCFANIDCPYGKVGDIIWVRETWRESLAGKYEYFADTCSQHPNLKWKPSIHMPKKACRLKLEITNIRLEQIQDISEEDAVNEGVSPAAWMPGSGAWIDYWDSTKVTTSARSSFRSLWWSINGAITWHSNYWVWVIEFKILTN